MRAMILEQPKTPLHLVERPIPTPAKGQMLLRIRTCGICRTDLHVVEGELPHPKLPLIPGHQIVGMVEKITEGITPFKVGDRVGVPWLQGSCGTCHFCRTGRENLCDFAIYTGYQVDGGFAEYCVANASFCFPLPDKYDDIHAAPLLCAGLIGYRALRLAGEGKSIGFYGFGASAHILIQIARFQGWEVYAFTREGDIKAQELALSLGAKWAGGSNTPPPKPLDAAIIFAPAGPLVPKALSTLNKGGIVVCAGIYMSDIPQFPYDLLWEERSIKSVANLTRRDGMDFLELATKMTITTHVKTYSLEQANQALDDLRHGKFSGAAVISL